MCLPAFPTGYWATGASCQTNEACFGITKRPVPAETAFIRTDKNNRKCVFFFFRNFLLLSCFEHPFFQEILLQTIKLFEKKYLWEMDVNFTGDLGDFLHVDWVTYTITLGVILPELFPIFLLWWSHQTSYLSVFSPFPVLLNIESNHSLKFYNFLSKPYC